MWRRIDGRDIQVGSTSTYRFEEYRDSEVVETRVYEDRVEQIILQVSSLSNSPRRVVKRVYRVQEGKLVREGDMLGTINSPRGETYSFEDEY